MEDRLLPIQTRSRVEIWSLQEATAAIRFIEKNFPALVPHFALRPRGNESQLEFEL